MNVIILAAGFGRRLQELTENTPKPLIEVRGRPLIHYHLEKVLSLGPDRIVINTHFLADKLEDNITQNFPTDQIIFSREQKILGTGGGIKNAFNILNGDEALVINSDIFTNLDYSKLQGFKSNTVFAIKSNSHSDFGIADGYVSLHGDQNYTFSGISVINRLSLESVNKSKFHYWRDLLKNLADNNELKAEILNVSWYDVGSKKVVEFLNEY